MEGTTGELCGPSGNYSYLWNNGATTRCITVGPGTFSLKVTDLQTRCQSPSCSFTIKKVPCACNLGYTDSSKPPRSSLTFDEQHILQAFDPRTCPPRDSLLRVFYNDEASMILGVRRVVVITSSGTTTTDFPVTPNPATPSCVWLPLAGDTAQSGDLAGTDRFERPWFPALFITDVTDNATNRSGDWQQGGRGIPPHKVCGRWKAVVRTIDKRTNPPKVTFTLDSDQAKNNWTLGPGSDTPTVGFSGLLNEGYGAEVAWNLNNLNLVPGHIYRLQFMFQDGDQTKSNGDAAHACINLLVPVITQAGPALTGGSGGGPNPPGVELEPVPGTLASGLPARLELEQNQPNPFYGTTTLRYALPEPAEVSLRVYSVLGREVALLVNGPVEAGYHSFVWHAAGPNGPLPPGVYMVTMRVKSTKSGAWHQVRKAILLR
jgi:hypothetical protein